MDWVKSESCPLRQLLEDPRARGSVHERRAFLQHAVQLARCSPPGSTFSSLCRQLAQLSFDVGEDEDGIFNLTESHAVLLRHKLVMKYHRSLRKNPLNLNVIHKKYVEFRGEYCEGYNSILMRLKDMPKEWTIIQLTCAVDSVWRFGGPNAKQWTPKLYIVRMECGLQPDFKPLYLELSPPPECAEFVVLEKIRLMSEMNRTDCLVENKRAFWEARSQVDEALKSVIDFTNSKWLGSINPFLTGSLADDELKNKIKDRVLKIVSKVMKNSEKCSLSDSNFCLLVKAAENINSLSSENLISVLARAVNEHSKSSLVKNLVKEYHLIKKEYSTILCNTQKHPVILIIDEKLEIMPLERLETLKDHPVTRVPSLHFIHGLYSVHKDTIENGLKMLDSEMGFYMINPSKNLNEMEQRMSEFLLPRVPSWKGVVGELLSGEEWCDVLKKNDMFVYMGHGSGSQYWNVEQTLAIKSTVLLFGCKSAGYKGVRGCVEVDGSLQSYLSAGCPCIVGMLWEVTDKDTDRVAESILEICLPKYIKESASTDETTESKKGKKKGIISNKTSPYIRPPIEPDIARAVNLGRKAAKMLLTQSAVIMRGLPVCIKPQ